MTALAGCGIQRAESDLQRAIKAHDAAAVQRLLAAGAPLGASMAEPRGPYELALWNLTPGEPSTLEILQLVIAREESRASSGEGQIGFATPRERPANATFRSGGGSGKTRTETSAVEIAARRCSPEGVTSLIQHGLTISGRAVSDGLVSAAANGCLTVIERLLDAGAGVNGRDQHADAPLAMARRVRNGAVAAYLLGRGAREARPTPQAKARMQKLQDVLGRIIVGDTSGMPSSQPPADDAWIEGADVLRHPAGQAAVRHAAAPDALSHAIRQGSVLEIEGTRAELHVVTLAPGGGVAVGTSTHVVELVDGDWTPERPTTNGAHRRD